MFSKTCLIFFKRNCGLENYFEKAFNNHILSSVSEKHINLLSWTCLNAHPLGNLLAFIKTYHLSIHRAYMKMSILKAGNDHKFITHLTIVTFADFLLNTVDESITYEKMSS